MKKSNLEQNNKIQISSYEKVSYWTIVWQQLKRNKFAIFGLWCILFLVLLAVYAPLLCYDKPYFLIHQGKLTFPLFKALFDRNCFENGVDIFFNLLMVLSPFFILSWYVIKIATKDHFRRYKSNLCLILLGIQIIAFIFLICFPHSHPYCDYKQLTKELKSQSEKISYLFPPIRYSFRESDVTQAHPKAPDKQNLLGTDKEGRDVFTRLVYGTRISLSIGVIAVSVYVIIGIILGALAGYFGGKTDIIISRLIEVMICFPVFFLILALVAFIEHRTIFHIMFVIGIVSWTGVARLTRGEFLKQCTMDYVQAAIALGIKRRHIIFSHILPNAIAPTLVAATFGIAAAILIESSLAFLGLGDPSAPSWGEMLSIGRMEGKLWLILAPGLAIFFVVSIFNLVGEGVRDAIDPKLRM